ncbi:MAG TPA: hypothetical protein PLE64_06845, partial [Spirochaetota bacterium]|nr:hypothetical protein [Spirochaetota bacterium]
MYDFKRYTFPEKRKINNSIYGFFSILFILVICIFTLIPGKSNNKGISAASNLNSVENKLIIDGVKMEDDMSPAETEGEIVYDDSFDDDIDINNIVTIEHNDKKIDKKDDKKKEKSFDIEKLKNNDKR